jgi:hypothetical protein
VTVTVVLPLLVGSWTEVAVTVATPVVPEENDPVYMIDPRLELHVTDAS